jgi:hypothetical protein
MSRPARCDTAEPCLTRSAPVAQVSPVTPQHAKVTASAIILSMPASAAMSYVVDDTSYTTYYHSGHLK